MPKSYVLKMHATVDESSNTPSVVSGDSDDDDSEPEENKTDNTTHSATKSESEAEASEYEESEPEDNEAENSARNAKGSESKANATEEGVSKENKCKDSTPEDGEFAESESEESESEESESEESESEESESEVSEPEESECKDGECQDGGQENIDVKTLPSTPNESPSTGSVSPLITSHTDKSTNLDYLRSDLLTHLTQSSKEHDEKDLKAYMREREIFFQHCIESLTMLENKRDTPRSKKVLVKEWGAEIERRWTLYSVECKSFAKYPIL